MADTFKLQGKPKQPSNNPHGEVIRISTEAFNCLVEMSNESPLPLGKIASKAIMYAYENVEYEVD